MTEAERNKTFKAALAARKAMLLPGVPNPLAARICEDIGYEALYLTGAGVSNMNLGVPDLGLITLNDVVDALSAIRNVVELPIMVDADTGFGNAVNVHYTVRKLEAAGANAIQIEDQLFPKKCGHFAGKEMIPAAEMVDKIRAAVDARRDANLQIVARTDARAVEGFQAAIDRASAYIEAGADVTFVEAVTSVEEMEQVPRLLEKPQIINIVFGGATPEVPRATLAEWGYGTTLYANAALQAAIAAMQRVLGELHGTGSLAGVRDQLAGFPERQRLVKKDVFDALETRYAKRGEQK